jgi:hypothetical protein
VDPKQAAVEILWGSFLAGLVEKRIQVSRYPSLRDKIPDDLIRIQDAVPFQDADEVYSRIAPLLDGLDVFPILGTLGGHMLCVGIGKENRGMVSYLDFDFGLFELGPIDEFARDLVDGETE